MQLKGAGSMSKRELVVITYDNSVTKNGKTQYLDVQLNAADAQAEGQTNLHARSVINRDQDGKPVIGKNGKPQYNNSAPYSVDQFEAIKAAAGDNHVDVTTSNGAVAHVYAVQADLMPARGKNASGLVINTAKPMEPSSIQIDETVFNTQYGAMAEARAAKAAEKEAQAPAPEAETEAAIPQADGPEL